jgi:PilZ domain
MGKRREPRKPAQVPVRIFGTDAEGKIFSEKVTTATVSKNGVRLEGVRAALKVDEVVGITYGTTKIHFRVRWVGEPGTPTAGAVGLVSLTPERPIWDFPLPHGDIDTFREDSRGDRRTSPRVKCSVSVELHPEDGSTTWGKASDLSVGGCFVEMPIPMKQGTKFEITLWISGTKLRLNAEVASSAPGYGIGVKFLDAHTKDREIINNFMTTLGPRI